jgi:hypothetical protein
MRDTFHLVFRDLVRNDGQPFIQLHCIAVDNFAIKSTSYLDGQLPAVMSSEWSGAGKVRTSDLPVPVAPTIAISGLVGAVAMLAAKKRLMARNMHPV